MMCWTQACHSSTSRYQQLTATSSDCNNSAVSRKGGSVCTILLSHTCCCPLSPLPPLPSLVHSHTQAIVDGLGNVLFQFPFRCVVVVLC